jgi:hypothetical protein
MWLDVFYIEPFQRDLTRFQNPSEHLKRVLHKVPSKRVQKAFISTASYGFILIACYGRYWKILYETITLWLN